MKGRPILGVVSGFLFGLFLSLTLFLYGVVPLASDWLWIIPLLGILVGLVLAAWAPFGKGAVAPAPPAAHPEPEPEPAPDDAPGTAADDDESEGEAAAE